MQRLAADNLRYELFSLAVTSCSMKPRLICSAAYCPVGGPAWKRFLLICSKFVLSNSTVKARFSKYKPCARVHCQSLSNEVLWILGPYCIVWAKSWLSVSCSSDCPLNPQRAEPELQFHLSAARIRPLRQRCRSETLRCAENISILAEWMCVCVFVRVITWVICCLIYVRMKHSGGAGATDGRGRSVCVVFLSRVFGASKMDSARQEEWLWVPSNFA